MTRDEILRTLGATPDRIRSLVQDLSPAQLQQQPKAREWSIGQTVTHLVLGERDVILPRLRRMQREDAPIFESSLLDKSGFAAEPSPSEPNADLGAFCQVRAETLAFLSALDNHDWQRLGTTPTRGTLTIEAYAEYLARHDHEHIDQLQRARSAVTGAKVNSVEPSSLSEPTSGRVSGRGPGRAVVLNGE
jgi:hypothetical protein